MLKQGNKTFHTVNYRVDGILITLNLYYIRGPAYLELRTWVSDLTFNTNKSAVLWWICFSKAYPSSFSLQLTDVSLGIRQLHPRKPINEKSFNNLFFKAVSMQLDSFIFPPLTKAQLFMISFSCFVLLHFFEGMLYYFIFNQIKSIYTKL